MEHYTFEFYFTCPESHIGCIHSTKIIDIISTVTVFIRKTLCTMVVTTIFVCPFHIVLINALRLKIIVNNFRTKILTFNFTIIVGSTKAFSGKIRCYRIFSVTTNTIAKNIESETPWVLTSFEFGTVRVQLAALNI